MQVQTPEVSAEKATTPGQRERSEAAYAAEYNRLNLGDYTAAHVASMRNGDNYGAGRAYLNGWWKDWQVAEAQVAYDASAFTGTVKGAKTTALEVFEGCHEDAKQAIEYVCSLLLVSDLAKQGGAQ